MAQPEMWEDEGTRRHYLGEQLNDGAICLLLGAGVSVSMGLPTWTVLLDRLYVGHESSRPTSLDLKRQAEYYKSHIRGGDDERFIQDVNRALYEGVNLDFAALRRNDMLGAIAALVMNSIRGRASTVISFNFDDLLETYLELHGFVVEAVGDESSWSRAVDVEVLHPHGFVPAKLGSRTSKRIVLDQKEYSKIVGDDSRPWRQRLLTAMRGRTCLFVGTSGIDDNMDSLITRAQETHAAVGSNTAYWGVWITANADPAVQRLWKDRGVFPLVLKNYEAIPLELFGIVQQAATQR